MPIYHSHLQALVEYLKTLEGSSSLPDGYSVAFSPSGQPTTAGSLGVTLTATSVDGIHTFEVEDAGAADHYVTVRDDGRILTRDERRGRDQVPYGTDLTRFMQPHIQGFLARLPTSKPPLDKFALNKNARRLLEVLYEGYLEARGNFFHLDVNDVLLRELGYDYPSYKQAASRLEERGLAKWAGQVEVTITPAGVEAAENPSLLDSKLPIATSNGAIMSATPDPKRVFVIYGRNLEARKQMGIYLLALGLDPINFDDLRAKLGGSPTIYEIVAAGMQQAKGVVALFTPDEYAALRPDFRGTETGEGVQRWQARANVLLETGWAIGIDRSRVVIVRFGNVNIPSDLGGIHLLSPTKDPTGHRNTLRITLKGMGCAVGDSSDWMTHGDFEAPFAGLSGVSPLDPFRTAP